MGRSKKKLKIANPKEDGEDRISSLPDDLIHRILSLIDAKEAVHTSLLSTRWKNVWDSLSHLSFDSSYFTRLTDFRKFLSHFLLYRDQQSHLLVFNLACRGVIPQSLIKRIATYEASHNLQLLNFSSRNSELPLSLFTSQSLKQLCLKGLEQIWEFPKQSWNLPALTTMFLEGFEVCLNGDGSTSKSLDLFSSLSNLKNLSLINCRTWNLEVFYIIAPQLEYLEIQFPKDSGCRTEFVISAPKLSSFKYTSNKPLLLSSNDLNCLVHINIDMYKLPRDCERKQRLCREIMNMCHQLSVAKFLTLSLQTIEVLSGVLELLKNQPSQF